jgi:hypothetical protein
MLYDTSFIKRILSKPNSFFMRFTNKTGSTVTVNDLSDLFAHQTGTPMLESAVVQRTNGITNNVKGAGNSILDFNVDNNESCVFKMVWDDGGVFSLENVYYSGQSYRYIVTSCGYNIRGNHDVPDNFMSYLFFNCHNYNQLPEDIFDTSYWYPTSIGDGFMKDTWYRCNLLTTVSVPNTRNWPINGSIGNNFMNGTWNENDLLTNITMIDTTNWNPSSIGNGFLGGSCAYHPNLTSVILPNTINWTVTGSIGNFFMSLVVIGCPSLRTFVSVDTTNWNPSLFDDSYFLYRTFDGAFNSTYAPTNTLTLEGGLYVANTTPLATKSGGLDNARIGNIKVTPSLVSTFQNSADWSNISNNKFIPV